MYPFFLDAVIFPLSIAALISLILLGIVVVYLWLTKRLVVKVEEGVVVVHNNEPKLSSILVDSQSSTVDSYRVNPYNNEVWKRYKLN